MDDSSQGNYVASITENYETSCWGCGLRLVLPTYSHVFKCGWCGAITDQNPGKPDSKHLKWRRIRDRCFVCILCVFMLFVICGGVWAVYPVVFAVSLSCSILHSVTTLCLTISTLSTFMLAAFKCAGKPPSLHYGTYPEVGNGYLHNYTFCYYCSRPKSPRTHHCRTCATCVFDMDHHCPFIGNCIGAGNHRNFVSFLISAIMSTIYVCATSAYTLIQISPQQQPPRNKLDISSHGNYNAWFLRASETLSLARIVEAVFMSIRGPVLVYLFVASASVSIGLSALLLQQLSYIYEGKTYLGHLQGKEEQDTEKSCRNLVKFFACSSDSIWRFLSTQRNLRKRHKI